MGKRQNLRKLFEEFLAAGNVARLDEEVWDRLRERAGGRGERTLRRLARSSGLPLDPLVEGVRQESFDELERSLGTLAGEYGASQPERRKKIRRLVIEAKDHARLAARRAKDPSVRLRKAAMADWMLVWLENPPIFPDWARLRRKAASEGGPGNPY